MAALVSGKVALVVGPADLVALAVGRVGGLVALVVDGRKRPLAKTKKGQLQNIAGL